MYGYVYKTTNLLNGKIYIGQHKSLIHDKKYFGSGKYIKRSLALHGVENFSNEILEWCDTVEELCEREIFWISKYNSLDNSIGYNIMKGGQAGDCTIGMSKEDYERYCKKLQGKNNPMYRSGERGIHPKGMEGKKHTESTKKKIKDSLTGEKNPFYGKSWEEFGGHPKGMKGKKHPKNTTWKHSVSILITMPNGDQRSFKTVSEAVRETEFSSAVIYSILEKGIPYAPNKSKFEHLRGTTIVRENTELI